MREEHLKWIKNKGDKTHRLNYNLNKDSIVFDLGGYKGEWSQQIYNKYKCKIYIFEPVHKFYINLKNKFKNNKNIIIINNGVSDSEKIVKISLDKDASSIFKTNPNGEKIRLINLLNFMEVNKIENIDLIKINIEGGEYEILEDIINKESSHLFNNLQIQFHKFIPKAPARRKKIQKSLSKTHKITYNYDFIWENWEKK